MLAVPDVVLASPFTRAWSTARLLREEARWPKAQRCDAIAGGELGAIRAAIDAQRPASVVAAVGHEPTLSALASTLLSGAVDVAIELRKGAIAWLWLPDGEDRAVLRAMLPLGVLRASA